jgi:ArsR family transcriptional regulator, cadmium/lead-responsive transcriptional repressor
MQAPDTATTATAPLLGEPAPVDLLAKYFRAFGDQTRLSILELLADGELSVGELVAATGQSQPNISNHLGCLRWCGFVVARREHRSVYYAIADDRVIALLALARTLLVDNERHVECCNVLGAEERESRAQRSR